MNSGGSPGPDDYGLPPADIEIPDDARELDRDVQAYYRELRARRRRTLTRRLWAPLTRDGLVLPLLAGCLAVTLLAGTLLTVFTASQGPFASARAARRGAATTRRAGGRLPDAEVVVGSQVKPLRSLTSAVIALVPPDCGCELPLSRLNQLAGQAGAGFYFAGIHGARLTGLAQQAGLPAAHAVQDPRNALESSYHPAGLTAIVVKDDGTVAAVMPVQGHSSQLARAIRSLLRASPQGLAPTVGTPLAASLLARPVQ